MVSNVENKCRMVYERFLSRPKLQCTGTSALLANGRVGFWRVGIIVSVAAGHLRRG